MAEQTSKLSDLQSGSEHHTETQCLEATPFGWRLSVRTPPWRPPTDVYETDEMLIVRVEIAGMREEDFAIELSGHQLSIHGVRQDIPERRAYHQMEIRFGEFNIDLELPFHVEAERVQAVYNEGILRVFLPKARPRQIAMTE